MNTIRELAQANGIEFLDLFPAFRSYAGSDPLYFSHDMHFTPAGQQVMARGIEEYIERTQLSLLVWTPVMRTDSSL